MRIIKTKQDIVTLRRVGVLPRALLNQVEDYFNQLRVELEDEAENEFRLGKNGYIVLLEAGDNVRDLGNVGLSRDDSGLLGSFPECVEPLDVGAGLQAYKVAVLYLSNVKKWPFPHAIESANYYIKLQLLERSGADRRGACSSHNHFTLVSVSVITQAENTHHFQPAREVSRHTDRFLAVVYAHRSL